MAVSSLIRLLIVFLILIALAIVSGIAWALPTAPFLF